MGRPFKAPDTHWVVTTFCNATYYEAHSLAHSVLCIALASCQSPSIHSAYCHSCRQFFVVLPSLTSMPRHCRQARQIAVIDVPITVDANHKPHRTTLHIVQRLGIGHSALVTDTAVCMAHSAAPDGSIVLWCSVETVPPAPHCCVHVLWNSPLHRLIDPGPRSGDACCHHHPAAPQG